MNADPTLDVVLIDKELDVARHQSSHNSGVVHAGLYYEPGSLKAALCRRGSRLMQDYCRQNRIPYEECGKLVVATAPGELQRLARLEERATANEVPGLRRLDASGIREIEPHVQGLAALHSPSTAITDFAAVAATLGAEIRERGGQIRLGAEACEVRREGAGAVITLAGGERVSGDRAIVCAGLQSDRLARNSGEPVEPAIVPFRGGYWQLEGASAELVKGLIYPVPDPSLPFLGVHLTRTFDRGLLAGPSALLSPSRENYASLRPDPQDLAETLRRPGSWKLFKRHWRAGVGELRRAASKRVFIAEARRYVPGLRIDDVVGAQVGIRAQAVDRDGSLVDDFRLGGDGTILWVRNAPSPGATSSLAIGEELVARLDQASPAAV
jgi:L-2-hydroxyglutarate oxidase LhgO